MKFINEIFRQTALLTSILAGFFPLNMLFQSKSVLSLPPKMHITLHILYGTCCRKPHKSKKRKFKERGMSSVEIKLVNMSSVEIKLVKLLRYHCTHTCIRIHSCGQDVAYSLTNCWDAALISLSKNELMGHI